MVIGAIEAGGTKFNCAVLEAGEGGAPPRILEEKLVATRMPEETLRECVEFFRGSRAGKVGALGIGSFGPIDPVEGSPTWGRVLATPKEGWTGVDLAGRFIRALSVPVTIDTDVDAAALGERLWGAARGIDDFIYLTVGTGIGGGAFVNGKLVHGAGHPEMGHIALARRADDTFEGSCPFHPSCFEGLAAGPAVEGRWGIEGSELPEGHAAWEMEAGYLAQGIASLAFAYSPRLFILGGGVGGRKDILRMTRAKLPAALGGYRPGFSTVADAEKFLVAPGLGGRAGILGSAALAMGK